MSKYIVYEDKDGNRAAHTEAYSKKSGEKQVGTVEADSVEQAMTNYESGQGQQQEQGLTAGGRQKSDSESMQKTREQEEDELRQAEEDKEEFEVMVDAKGNYYVEGGDSDPSKSKTKAAKAPEPLPEVEPASVGTFRAKDEKEALARARGEFHDPAEGAARGAQTP
jgi:hypothetical protein